MNGLLRKLRGMCGLGIIWAALWTPIGVGIMVAQMFVVGFWPPPLDVLLWVAVSGARNGFLAGFLFAAGLGLAYRRRGFAELRVGAMGVVGAIVGMLLPASTMIATAVAGYFVPPLISVVLSLTFGGALGAATAIGSLKLAQAAPAESGSGRLGSGGVVRG